MGINDKNNNAYGKDPDYGAIFMSNSETKRECFKRGLFGLPSSDIQFVEQIKITINNTQNLGLFHHHCCAYH